LEAFKEEEKEIEVVGFDERGDYKMSLDDCLRVAAVIAVTIAVVSICIWVYREGW